MTNILQSHHDHTILESNIRFYALEINFLLKIINREYGIMANMEKVKMLDSYWKEFEKYRVALAKLSEKIKKEERIMHEKYLADPSNTQNTPDNITLISEFTAIIDELKLLKQSLYDYMENMSSNQH